MARRYKIPDPANRSPNEPAHILKAEAVLDIYNQDHPDDEMQRVTDKVKAYVIEKAKTEGGWKEGTPVDNMIMLEADVRLHRN